MLGGSSSINGLIYIRGQAEDFDHWRQLGNAGWGSDDVLPYFRKAEGNERGADELHGGGGPLGVSDLRDRHPLAAAYVEAAQQCGYPRNDDFNGAAQEGAGLLPDHDARRRALARPRSAYLDPARRRANLRRGVRRRWRRASCSMAGARSASSITVGGETRTARAPVPR